MNDLPEWALKLIATGCPACGGPVRGLPVRFVVCTNPKCPVLEIRKPA